MRTYIILGCAFVWCAYEYEGGGDMGRVVSKLPRIIAHRGFSGRFPENTLRAFKECVPYSHMFECDVWFSSDRKMVVLHDESLLRVAGNVRDVRMVNSEELRMLDVGKLFDEQYVGERIPMLEEVMALVAHTPVKINIEIKFQPENNRIQPGLIDAVVALVRATKQESKVVISSFDHSFVDALAAHGLSTSRRLLFGFAGRTYLRLMYGIRHMLDYVRRFDVTGVNINKCFLSRRLLTALHNQGLQVGVYSVDTIDEMETYVAWGVDDIYTKHPDMLHQYLTAHHRMRPLARA